MGGKIYKLLSSLFERRQLRIIMVGLDGAGKTTILYKFKLDEIVTSIPTIGFNVETVQYKDSRFTVWDIGGQSSIRPLWKRYFQHTQGIIFVVDATDHDRIEEAANELRHLMSHDDLQTAVLLVFANKQDLPYAMKPKELVDKLRLYNFPNRKWYIQSACATMCLGLFEGLEWLSRELSRR